MSKKFLKEQAKKLLSSELRKIKGGIFDLVCDNSCQTCTASCSGGCKRKSKAEQ